MLSSENAARILVEGSWLPLREGRLFVQFPDDTARLGGEARPRDTARVARGDTPSNEGERGPRSTTTREAYLLIRLASQSVPTVLTLYPVRGTPVAPKRGPAISRTIVPAFESIARVNVLEQVTDERETQLKFEIEGDIRVETGTAPQLERYVH